LGVRSWKSLGITEYSDNFFCGAGRGLRHGCPAGIPVAEEALVFILAPPVRRSGEHATCRLTGGLGRRSAMIGILGPCVA